MSRLVTLKKQDPLFESYLTGRFSKTERALPLQTLNVETESEQVTFEIKSRSEIIEPRWFLKWPIVLRFKSMAQIAIPLFLIFAKNILDGTASEIFVGLFAGLGAVSCYVGLNLINDYVDHLRGLDRIFHQAGNQAIQKGWVAAWTVKVWGWAYLLIGFFLGLPALLASSEILWLVAIASALGAVSIVVAKRGRKLIRLSEFSAFLLLGPLLTLGFQLALGGSFDLEVLALGALTGWLAVFRLHFKNFQQLMVGTQSKFVNSMTSLGFEGSKLLLKFWWLFFVASFIGYFFLFSNTLWLSLAVVLQFGLTLVFFHRMDQLQSPVGSAMVALASSVAFLGRVVYLFWFAVGCWQLSFVL